jgi:hypothetical protein
VWELLALGLSFEVESYKYIYKLVAVACIFKYKPDYARLEPLHVKNAYILKRDMCATVVILKRCQQYDISQYY